MNASMGTTVTPDRIHADHGSQKRLGNWTTARAFEVRARRSLVVIDLRSPQIPAGDIEIHLDLDHSTIKLLVAGDAVIDQWVRHHADPGRPGARGLTPTTLTARAAPVRHAPPTPRRSRWPASARSATRWPWRCCLT